MTTPTANSVLMGGGGAPAYKFTTPGETLSGRIVAISEPYQEREYDKLNPGNGALKTFKNGNPIMTFNIDLLTTLRDPSIEDDDGTRRVYMDGARIKKAVRAAVQAAGADGLAIGATLSITYTHDDVAGDPRSGKNYQVTYQPGSASNNVLMGQQHEQPAPPAPAYAPPAPPTPPAQAYTPPAPPAPPAQPAPTPQTPPAPQPTAAPPAQAEPATASGPNEQQLAALRAAGIDPATVFPGYGG